MPRRRRRLLEIEPSTSALREFAASQVDAREDERRHIARELHDELGQSLSTLKMELASLAADASTAGQAGRIAAMLAMLDEAVASVRRLATDLRPAMLDDLGLNAAIEWLARESGRRLGVGIRLRLDRCDPPIGSAASIAVYRMAQEALNNVARHAEADEVCIDMRCEGGELVLAVQDNGVGFAEPQLCRPGSHGLMGIRERALTHGGRVEIGNAAGGGGQLVVRLPLPGQAAPGSSGHIGERRAGERRRPP